jgi:uncharacterized membrane protein YsdA (DUF1294 family)
LSRVSIAPAISFLAAVAVTVHFGRLPLAAAWLYGGLSLISFVAYGVDKSAAAQGRWRISESTLQLLGLLGGWPGAAVAQRVFRHKVSKLSFQSLFWVTVVLNVTALLWFAWRRSA